MVLRSTITALILVTAFHASNNSVLARAQDRFAQLYSEELPASGSTEILFQAFGWDSTVNSKEGEWYNHLKANALVLKELGITHIWYPPVSRSVAHQGYMPGDYYDLGSEEDETYYGNEKELKDSLARFRSLGIQTVADVVVNHRTASHQEDGVWNVFHHKSGKMMWKKWALAKDDYKGTGAADTGDNFTPAPDIDHTNEVVRHDITKWLKWMKNEIGFDGWRFDFVKGYSGNYVAEYVNRSEVNFAIGEFWSSMGYQSQSILNPNQDPHRQKIVDWVDETRGIARAFDFTTKGILQEAVSRREYWRLKAEDGRQSGVMGWWPGKAVTFIDNHDTGSKQSHWPFPAENILEGYAYILTHPGTPTIFYEHYFEWGSNVRHKIQELAQLRVTHNVHKTSELTILEARQGFYLAEVGNKLLVQLGDEPYCEKEGWELAVSGQGYFVSIR